MASETVTVTLCDVDLVVHYDYTPYRAATHWQPDEGGDIEISEIIPDGKNIDGLLAGFVMERIYDAIDRDIKERRREAEEERELSRMAA